eukprot:scaffold14144_cov91-Skeletonema_dohrnii-CCMP3373.AAC.3
MPLKLVHKLLDNHYGRGDDQINAVVDESSSKGQGIGVVAFAVSFPPPILPDLKARASRTAFLCGT